VDDSGRARLADFGLATVTREVDSVQSTSCQHGHTARWAAPEVLSEGTYSKKADVFAFAMVMIEVLHRRLMVYCVLRLAYRVSPQVFTGAVPFSGDTSVMAMLAITQGRRPPWPTDPACTENLWTLMQRCWDHDPHSRPEVSEVLRVLLTPSVSRSFR
jgi:serine/threonine protein kinase